MTTGTLNLGNLFSIPICCYNSSLKDAQVPRLFLDLLCLDSGQNRRHCSAPAPRPPPHMETARFSMSDVSSALLCMLVFVHPSPWFCVSSSNHSPWVISFTFVTSATIPLRDTPNSVSSYDLARELLTSISDFLQVVCSQGPLNFSQSTYLKQNRLAPLSSEHV